MKEIKKVKTNAVGNAQVYSLKSVAQDTDYFIVEYGKLQISKIIYVKYVSELLINLTLTLFDNITGQIYSHSKLI